MEIMQPKICLFPVLNGPGGPTSFQGRLAAGLQKRGIDVTPDPSVRNLAAILIIGGSSSLIPLWQARRRGVHIVHRLNGMNWIHRRRRTGLRHYLRAEYGNRLLALIRSHLAQSMVYQSCFAQQWWQDVYGPDRARSHVIYNAVDLSWFTPLPDEQPPVDKWRLLVVEGNLGGGYDWGLEVAVKLANKLSALEDFSHRPFELVVAGGAESHIQQAWQARSQVPLHFTGWLPRREIPELDRSAHLLYAADIHPACPNSVIEALACGLPVLAFDTGALRELVTPDAGRVVPYGGDAWQLEPPDIPGLVRAAGEILTNQGSLRRGARQLAEQNFDLEKMVDTYLHVLLGSSR